MCRCETRRRSAGFTLVEVLLTILMVMAFTEILVTGLYSLKLSVEHVSRHLRARTRAQRVISYLEPRVMNSGIGLWACPTIHKARLAFGRGDRDASETLVIAQGLDSQSFPARVYKRTPPFTGILVPLEDKEAIKDDEGNLVFRGDALALLYAVPTGIFVSPNQPLSMALGEEKKFDVFIGTDGLGGTVKNISEAFDNSLSSYSDLQNIKNWCVLPSLGLPARILVNSNSSVTLRLAKCTELPDGAKEIAVPQVMELYRIMYQRFQVSDSVFHVEEQEVNWTINFPRENDILATWYELRLAEKRLDVWVLASGGAAVFGKSSRPAIWPREAPWLEKDFSKQELYVARASWHLYNLMWNDF